MTLVSTHDYADRTDSSAQGLHFVTASARQPARPGGNGADSSNSAPVFASDDINSAFLDDFVGSDSDDAATGWQSIFAPVPSARSDPYAERPASSGHFAATSGGNAHGIDTSSSGNGHFSAASGGNAHGIDTSSSGNGHFSAASGGNAHGADTSSFGNGHFSSASGGTVRSVEIPSSGSGHLGKSSDGSARKAGTSSDDGKYLKISAGDDSSHSLDVPSSVKFGTLTTGGEKAPDWTADEITSASKVARKAVDVSVHGHTESESFVPAVDDDHGGAIDRVVSALLQGSTASSSAALGVRGDTISDFTPVQHHIDPVGSTDIGALTGFSTESAHTVDAHHALGLTGFEF